MNKMVTVLVLILFAVQMTDGFKMFEVQDEKCEQLDYLVEDASKESFLLFKEDFFEETEALQLMEELYSTLPWDWTYYMIDGERIRGPRKMAWFADGATWEYSFSANHIPGLPVQTWTPALLKIRKKIEDLLGEEFNSVLANLYVNPGEHSAWHSDDDPWLGYPKPSNVPSVTFGDSRDFHWRPKDNYTLEDSQSLTHNSFLVMSGRFQETHQHSVPGVTSVTQPYRINLTFRQILYPERRPQKERWGS